VLQMQGQQKNNPELLHSLPVQALEQLLVFGLGKVLQVQETAKKHRKAELLHSLPVQALEQLLVGTCRLGSEDPSLLGPATIQKLPENG